MDDHVAIDADNDVPSAKCESGVVRSGDTAVWTVNDLSRRVLKCAKRSLDHVNGGVRRAVIANDHVNRAPVPRRGTVDALEARENALTLVVRRHDDIDWYWRSESAHGL